MAKLSAVCCFVLLQFCAVVSAQKAMEADTSLPVVLWHGMGDSCFNPLSMGSLVRLVEKTKPGIYTNCLKIGKNLVEDTLNGFFKPVNEQITQACEMIGNDTNLQHGYNAIGFSQGGQFLRAVAQRCPNPPMHNLISVGGQHQGVFGFPRCPQSTFTWMCDKAREMLSLGAYTDEVQKGLVQAQYWHDPTEEAEYKAKSLFIAEINQDQTVKPEYKTNLQKLNTFVMVRFNNDTMVIPRESEWFGYYVPGQDQKMQTLQQSAVYVNDTLGLQAMDKAGKLKFLATDGDHLQFTSQWFIDNIVNVYL